eukprot:TRINITY_DN6057_c0_g1_i14.p1 TRINITY_DN6057_c0_g1~~TRINITY_DN6057_c0_g1_i14.p1  ORF type:complete len:793 (-),score=133.69 TRINITY_DN6057_c0_g1_i14:249-2627(-)
MGTRINQIRETCKIPPEQRTEESISEILEFVRDVRFFQKLSPLQQRTLCRTMALEVFAAREQIMEVGEYGDKFYIILQGSCSAHIPVAGSLCPTGIHPQPEKCNCKARPFDTAFLEKGRGFGELALQSDTPRTASIFANEETELLVTTRADFEKHAGELHKLFIDQRVRFLRQCPLIQEALESGAVSTKDIAVMANCLNEKSLSGNELIVQQGELVEQLIFVISGSLAMLKVVEPESAAVSKKKADSPARRRRVGLAADADKAGKHRGKIARLRRQLSYGGPPMTDHDRMLDSSSDEEEKPKAAMGLNLAKAVFAMKQTERDEKLKGILQEQRRRSGDSSNLPSVATEDLMGRRRNSGLQNFKPEDAALVKTKSKDKTRPAPAPRSGKELWGLVRAAFKQASIMKMVSSWGSPSPNQDATSPAGSGTGVKGKTGKETKGRKDDPNKKSKKIILRIGSIGAFQHYGEKQVCNGETFPCSLVSDPIAEVYTMNKHDILRLFRHSSRHASGGLFVTLFSPSNERSLEPTDAQLMDMYMQTERWFSYRRSMHGEARVRRDQERKHQQQHLSVTNGGIDAIANLDFLGVNPASATAARVLPPPRPQGVQLTRKDEEVFSQTSARFLRRFDVLKRDPGLERALKKQGRFGRFGEGAQDEENDPMSFKFEQQWLQLRKDPISLDLGEDLIDISRPGTTPKKNEDKSTWSVGGQMSRMVSTATNKDGSRSVTPTAIPSVVACTADAPATSLSSTSERPGTASGPVAGDGKGPGQAWTATVTSELPPIVEVGLRKSVDSSK